MANIVLFGVDGLALLMYRYISDDSENEVVAICL